MCSLGRIECVKSGNSISLSADFPKIQSKIENVQEIEEYLYLTDVGWLNGSGRS